MDPNLKGVHGAHSRRILTDQLGFKQVRRLVDSGRLHRFSRGVLIDPHRATEFRCRAAAALLSGGTTAVLYGHSALCVHGISAARSSPIHILLPYYRKPRKHPHIAWHHGRSDGDPFCLDELRCTSLEHAITEVVCRDERRTAIACLDQVLASVSDDEREAMRSRIAHRLTSRDDPRGTRAAEFVLALATGLAESPMESWMLLTLVEGGMPIPEQQWPIFDLSGRVRYRLDFAWPDWRLAVEYDGFESHEGRSELDAHRDADLRRRGRTVIRATVEDLKNPATLIAAIRSHIAVGSMNLAA